MCAGAFLVLGGLVLINTAGTNKNEGKTTKVVNFDLKKIVQKKVTRKRKEKRKKRRKKSKSIPTAPKISSLMSGNSFGVAGLEFNNDPIDGSLLGVKGDQVMDEASVDTAPVPRRRMAPEYPASARNRGIGGYVILNILVNKKGEVEKTRVLESNPNGIFDDAAIDSIRNWEFDPAKYKGKVVKVWVKQKFSFNLN